MNNTFPVSDLSALKRDLALRGYSEAEIEDFLNLPVIIIPGPITPQDSNEPTQKLTNHIVFLLKNLQKEAILSQIVLRKNIPRKYIEERHAHIDLGTIVMGIVTAQQVGAFANVAQILDFLLNLIQYKFGSGRTAQLMPEVKFNLQLHNGKKSAQLQVEGRADAVTEIVSEDRLKVMLESLQELPEND